MVEARGLIVLFLWNSTSTVTGGVFGSWGGFLGRVIVHSGCVTAEFVPFAFWCEVGRAGASWGSFWVLL